MLKLLARFSLKIAIYYALITNYHLLIANPIYAADFAVDRQITYTVNEDLITTVQEQITIHNLTTEKFPQTYQVTITGFSVNHIYAQDHQSQTLAWETNTSQSDSSTTITVHLPSQAIGKGAQQQFQLLYDLPQSVTDQGQIRELKLPQLIIHPLTQHTQVTLLVHPKLGQLAYLTPQPQTQTTLDQQWLQFQLPVSQLQTSGLIAVFGDFQLYNFTLNYYLSAGDEQTIALPPDTDFQKIAISSITPLPQTVSLDPDGNWLAQYSSSPPGQTLITVTGQTMVFANPWRQSSLSNRDQWLTAQPYWEVHHPTVSQLSPQLYNPKLIYQYLVNNLQYDYQRLSNESTRQGAAAVLSSPQSAICMEFTDAFITLARAAGWPARQIIGYAHSDSPQLKPLSLIADVLHAWPEYWDDQLKIWQPVDPTWGTTSGLDYFQYWDLNHVALVINGLDSAAPRPAGFYKHPDQPQRDLTFTLGGQFPSQTPMLSATLQVHRPWWPFANWNTTINLANPGPTAVYHPQITQIHSPRLTIQPPDSIPDTLIPPYGQLNLPLQIKPQVWFLPPQPIYFTVNQQSLIVHSPWLMFTWPLMVSLALGGICVILILASFPTAKKLRRLSV